MKISFEEFEKIAERYHRTGRGSRNKEIEVLETANRVAGERIKELEKEKEILNNEIGDWIGDHNFSEASLEKAEKENTELKKENEELKAKKEIAELQLEQYKLSRI